MGYLPIRFVAADVGFFLPLPFAALVAIVVGRAVWFEPRSKRGRGMWGTMQVSRAAESSG